MKNFTEDYENDASMIPAEPMESYPVIDEPIPATEAASELLDEPLSTVGSITSTNEFVMESDVAIGRVIVEKGERIRILPKREAKRWKEENPIANGGSSEAPMDVDQKDKGEKMEIVVDGSEQLVGGDSLAAQNTMDKVAYGLSADAHGDAYTGTKTDKGIGEAIRRMEAEIARLKRAIR